MTTRGNRSVIVLIQLSAVLSFGLTVLDLVRIDLDTDSPTLQISFDGFGSQIEEIKHDIVLFSPKYACGGGMISTAAASLVSFPCDYTKLHVCCQYHDFCYDSRIGQEVCDEYFCGCLQRIESEGPFCDLMAHYGLCAATRTLGHFFYEHGDTNHSALALLGDDSKDLLAQAQVTLQSN